jgi:small-conductance mechanosensitive channel
MIDEAVDRMPRWAALLDQDLLGNPLSAWLMALSVTLAILLLVRVVRRVLASKALAWAQRTRSGADDAVLGMVGRTRSWFVMLIGVYAGTRALELAEGVERVLDGAFTIGAAVQAGLWANVALASFFERYQARRRGDADAATAIAVMSFGGSVLVWSLLLLLALDNLGIDVTAMVAGLGIGGIAVALAVQNILGDLFASVSIIVDRPFVVGDFIIVDDYMGTVEHVGLKTTHLRSLGGEQLVFANNDLLKARVRNYKRMYERRVVFTFGLEYATPPEQLEWVSSFLREMIGTLPDVRLERAHFFKFGDSSLDFEVAYWVKSPDYGRYMDLQQTINLQLMRALAERKIGFAYPTRTVKLQVDPPADAPRDADRAAGTDPARGH